ncbi:MAG: bifunctional demethylmenaquinone methyltransferase/2-methoxy-6-polyprenyl-1,4-benzoquinol methylase UbiE [Nitrospinaceae bacterium]
MQTLEDAGVFSRRIQAMFNAVAPRYDFLNRFLSAGRDGYWRKKAVNLLSPRDNGFFLDVATGTADMALEIASRHAGLRVAGIDFSASMLELGHRKIRSRGLEKKITLQAACGENLPFAEGSFDGVVTAFGIRNFSDPARGLREMFRILKTKGRIVILEFSHPRNVLLAGLYRLYFHHILPRLGRLVSGHDNAYHYLPQSVSRFPARAEFARTMSEAGFQEVTFEDLTCGIVTIYSGIKHGR